MKPWNAKVFLLLVFSMTAISAIVFHATGKNASLYCELPVYDFGRIPSKDNAIVGIHKFRIENTTTKDIFVEKIGVTCSCVEVEPLKVIRPGKDNFLSVRMTLSPEQTRKREVGIILVPAKKEIPEIQLRLIGRSELKPSLSQHFLSMGKAIQGKTKTATIMAYFPSEVPDPANIKTIQVFHSDLRIRTTEKIFLKDKESGDLDINMTQIRLTVDLTPTPKSPLGETKTSIKIKWHNDEEILFPVSWTHAAQRPFERDKITLFDVSPGNEKTFQITYDKDAKGELKEYAAIGENLAITQVLEAESYVQFSLRYLPQKEPQVRAIGYFQVKTKSGEEYILPIEKE